jgi:tRNA (mo5U34)-methyltransferase
MQKLLDNRLRFQLNPFYNALETLVRDKEAQLAQAYGVEKEMAILIGRLPTITPSSIDLDADIIRIGHETDLSHTDRALLFHLLKAAHPWRKGPFELFGIRIDTEWLSHIKWNRLKDHISPLGGRRILDIGSSSGYYMFRMAAQNPELVLGIEPYIRFHAQYRILQKYIRAENLFSIPAKLEELPPFQNYFHTVFCMGILYHRKSPIETLEQIRRMMEKNGEVILETLILEEDSDRVLCPEERYAKMRNIFFIPALRPLFSWMKRAGFTGMRCVDISATTGQEQRKTEWVNTESLTDFLDPHDPLKTVEGYPAPVRAMVIAQAK